MRRSISLAGVVLSLLAVAGTAGAGASFGPSGLKIVQGAREGGSVSDLSLDDDSYLDIRARRAGSSRKVVFRTTHTGLPTADDTLGMTWVGGTGLKQTCQLAISVYLWSEQRWIVVRTDTANETPPDFTSTAFLPGADDSEYVKDGKGRFKVACKEDARFVLRTDRLVFTS